MIKKKSDSSRMGGGSPIWIYDEKDEDEEDEERAVLQIWKGRRQGT
jgi:hypothetical protein